MSIKDNDEFHLLYANALYQYHQLFSRKNKIDCYSYIKASNAHGKLTNMLTDHIDKYVDEQRKEAIEAFKQTDEFLAWRIH